MRSPRRDRPQAAGDPGSSSAAGESRRDAEGRKRAMSTDEDRSEEPSKRPKRVAALLDERVATARSLCSAETEANLKRLCQPSIDAFMNDDIDAAELERRKATARKQALAEHEPLVRLEDAYAAYNASVEARTAAEKAEDAAKARLECALRVLEPQSSRLAAVEKAAGGQTKATTRREPLAEVARGEEGVSC